MTRTQPADVRYVARESWWHDGQQAKVISVDEGVVSLPTIADARRLFDQFSTQWKECDGKIVTVPDGPFRSNPITHVRVANSVLAANVSLGAENHALPDARAVGVRGNCLVEVEVTFYSTTTASDQGSADVNSSAIDIAHIMMDKISALS